MGVDFVKPEDKAGAAGKPGSYDVEYTNPAVDNTPAPKRKTSLLNWLSRPTTAAKPKKPASAQPVTLPPQQSGVFTGAAKTNSAAVQPNKAYAITEHQTAVSAPNTVVFQGASSGNAATKKPAPLAAAAPLEQRHVSRVLPPPPPPPTHMRGQTKTVLPQPVAAKAPQPTAVTPQSRAVPAPAAPTPPIPVQPLSQQPIAVAPQPVSAPVQPASPLPVAPTPIKPVLPGAPSAPRKPQVAPGVAPASKIPTGAPRSMAQASAPAAAAVASDGSVTGPIVIARNVTGMHGDTTNPDMLPDTGLDVNLLPEYAAASMRGLSAPLRLLRFAVVCVCFFTLIYGAMVGYEAYYIFRTEIGQQRLQALNTEILGYAELQQDVSETNDTLAALNDLLTNHIYWSNWFTFLEVHTLPNVYFTDLTGSNTGAISLEGVAEDYTAVTHQVNAFRAAGDEVQSVEVNTATRSSEERLDQVDTTEETDSSDTTDVAPTTIPLVHFTISLHVDPAILLYTSDYKLYE